jgi:uncharacterized integral membrane protein (TIGR02327 family)
MNIKVYLYVIFTGLSIFALSGINFNNIVKKNKVIESRILVMLLAFALGYLLTNFVYDFVNSIGTV